VKFVYLVWTNLKRRKMRTVLTVLSILVAFMLFAYLAAIRQGFSQGIDVAGLDRLIVRHKVSIIQMLPVAYERRIEQVDGVVDAVYQTWFGGIYQKPTNFFPQMPVNPEEYLAMYPDILLSDAERQAWLNTRSGAIAGRQIAERFGWKVGDRIPINATIWPRKSGETTWEFDLVGIYDGAEKSTDTTMFLFRYDFFDESRQFGQGLVGWYTVRIADPEHAAEVAAAIDSEFANSRYETKTEAEGAFLQGFADQLGNVALIITSIVAAVFFTILIVAGNTMAYSVRERTNELAVLKAIGFSDRGVLALVLGECFLLTALGGGLGLLLGWLLVSMGDPTGGSLPLFYVPDRDLLLGVLLIVGTAFVAGILPALQAGRLRIADALRR
jgi:putative ABC transport system permease protein